jgi:hypothetical protein
MSLRVRPDSMAQAQERNCNPWDGSTRVATLFERDLQFCPDHMHLETRAKVADPKFKIDFDCHNQVSLGRVQPVTNAKVNHENCAPKSA